MSRKTENLAALIDVGVSKMIKTLMDYVDTVSDDHSDQINIVKNVLLNVECNIFKGASEKPEHFVEKLNNHIKRLKEWQELALKNWDQESFKVTVEA